MKLKTKGLISKLAGQNTNMAEPPFTIRIHTEKQDMDWMVRLEEVTFRQTLVSLPKIRPDGIRSISCSKRVLCSSSL